MNIVSGYAVACGIAGMIPGGFPLAVSVYRLSPGTLPRDEVDGHVSREVVSSTGMWCNLLPG